MKKSILTLLDKLLDIEDFYRVFYEGIANHARSNNLISLRNTAAILAKEEKRHVEVYQKMIEQVKAGEDIQIEEELIGEVDYYLITLKQSASSFGIMTARQLIAMAVDCENKQVFLISRILEFLNREGASDFVKEVFTKLLNEEQRHVNNLRPFV